MREERTYVKPGSVKAEYMSLEHLRSDFPIVEDLIYLDSAATSLTPEPVLDAVTDYYRSYRSNVGRGIYRTAQVADQLYRNAHRKVARFIRASPDGLIFTRNATEAINAVAQGLRWRRGDVVVTTIAEHHSNLIPWLRLKGLGVIVKIVRPDADGLFDPADFAKAASSGARLIAVSALSNVLGTILPIRAISEISREAGALYLVDGAQYVPHIQADVTEMDCDFLCFSGHKMLGPTGTGVLWMKDPPKEKCIRFEDTTDQMPPADSLEPLSIGGGMVEEVSLDGCTLKAGYEGMEAGTPHIAGGLGLGAAVDYLEAAGMNDVFDHERYLTRKLLLGLQGIRGVKIYGPQGSKDRAGVVSFNVEGMAPIDVAMMLDEASNIAVRSGYHCCMPLMKHLGLIEGSVRASVYLYNTIDEIELLLGTIEEISRAAGC